MMNLFRRYLEKKEVMRPDNKAHRSNVAAMLAAAFSFVRMGLIWATGWVLVGMLGVVVFYALFPSVPDIVDIWIPVFAYPGFLAGVGFSVMLRVAEGRRRFDDLSFPRLAAWGAVAGLLVGVLPFVLGTPSASYPLWLMVIVIIGATTLLSAVSAIGSAFLLRRTAWGRSPAGTGLDR